jgi:SprB repeat/Secretion system C-terminal sorting domain
MKQLLFILCVALCATFAQAQCSVSIASVTNATCFGGANGSATLLASGGLPPYRYEWRSAIQYTWVPPPAPFATTAQVNTLYANSYIVDVFDANNCQTAITVNIGQAAQIVSQMPTTVSLRCAGDSLGTIPIQATGGTPPYRLRYQYPLPQAPQYAFSICGSPNPLVIEDTNGCIGQANTTLSSPLPLDISLTTALPTTCTTCCDGQITTATQGGTPPYTYQWSTGGATVSNPTMCVGAYSATATDANGCSDTLKNININDNTTLTINFVDIQASGCPQYGRARALVSGGLAPYTYLWSGGQVLDYPTHLFGSIHTVTVTDANGTTASATVSIPQIPDVAAAISVVSPVTACQAGELIVQAVHGTPPYSYTWNTAPIQPTQNLTNLYGGSYTVTVSDANGCTVTASAVLAFPSYISFTTDSIKNVTCAGGNDGGIYISVQGGTSPYTYNWNNANNQTVQDISNLSAGVYTVIVTDANGCTSSYSSIVTEPQQLTATATSTNVFCYGGSDGSISVNTQGGTGLHTYIWSTPFAPTLQVVTGLYAGVYTVTVTDSNLCTTTASTVITEPAPLNVIVSNITPATCQTVNGSATANATGGTQPYTYYWDNGEPSQTATNLGSDTHTSYVTDAVGCSSTVSFFIPETGCVYPGDADNDGVANNLDLLPIALHNTATGTGRPSGSTQWTGQYCNDWSQNIQNTTTNLKYTDCDGDGTIAAADTLVILQNYGQTHQRQPFIATPHNNSPSITCNFPTNNVLPTVFPYTLQAGIMIGDAASPATDIMGLAFTINYDPMAATSANMLLTNLSWLGADSELYHLTHDDGQGHLDIAVSRFDGAVRNGYGQVATVNFIIEDNVIGRGMNSTNYPFVVNVTGIKAINNQNMPKTVIGTQTQTVLDNMITNTTQTSLNNAIIIAPNPVTNGVLTIKSPINCQTVTISNVLGQVLLTQPIEPSIIEAESNFELKLPILANGIYLLTLTTAEGSITKRIIVR